MTRLSSRQSERGDRGDRQQLRCNLREYPAQATTGRGRKIYIDKEKKRHSCRWSSRPRWGEKLRSGVNEEARDETTMRVPSMRDRQCGQRPRRPSSWQRRARAVARRVGGSEAQITGDRSVPLETVGSPVPRGDKPSRTDFFDDPCASRCSHWRQTKSGKFQSKIHE